jgi:hypothetical protein
MSRYQLAKSLVIRPRMSRGSERGDAGMCRCQSMGQQRFVQWAIYVVDKRDNVRLWIQV